MDQDHAGNFVGKSTALRQLRVRRRSGHTERARCPICSANAVMNRPRKQKAVRADDAPVSMIDRLERALVLAAYIVVRHGPVYAPYIDRLERELEAARQNDPMVRARRILETYAVDGSAHADLLNRLRTHSKDHRTR